MASPSEPEPLPPSTTGDTTGSQPADGRKPATRTRSWVVVTGAILALLALAFWRPLQRQCAAYLLLQAEAPADEVLSDALEQAHDPAELLLRLWHTDKLPHRQFVASHLQTACSSNSAPFGKLEPVLLDAAADPDVEVRQQAFATLDRLHHPQLHPLTLEQLSDPDPAVRLIGLHALRRIANSNDVPTAMRFLDDPEPRVVVAAALLLRQVTGHEFGLNSRLAVPQFTCFDTNPPPAPNLAAILQGRLRGREWWRAHQAEYPPSAPPFSPHTAITLATPDFKLRDCCGKSVRLTQFRGKSVLLVFWSPGVPASLEDIPALNALAARKADHLAVIGIAVPAAPGCADDHAHAHGPDHAHSHHHHAIASAVPTDMNALSAFAEQAAERLHISFPMLVDREGNVARRFCAADLPTYALLDDQGRLRRRFVGFRTAQALAAIVEIASAPGTSKPEP